MKKLRITVGDKSYDVTVELLEDDQGARPAVPVPPPASPQASAPPPAQPGQAPSGPVAAGTVVSPMSGTIKSIEVKAGDSVSHGQVVAVLDAMKMENRVVSPADGAVKSVMVQPGQTVQEGQPLLVIG